MEVYGIALFLLLNIIKLKNWLQSELRLPRNLKKSVAEAFQWTSCDVSLLLKCFLQHSCGLLCQCVIANEPVTYILSQNIAFTTQTIPIKLAIK